MKKLLVYPFDKNTTPLIRYADLLDNFQVVSGVPMSGYFLEHKDTCELDGGLPTGFKLKASFIDEIRCCDVVLTDNSIAEKLHFLDFGKEIINYEQNVLSDLDLHIMPNVLLKEIPVPVIMVLGQGENCQKFEIQLGMRKALLQKGYKVSQFGTKTYSHLFGFNQLPTIIDIPSWKKVFAYNQLFYETYIREKPDVIIIGVPGGIMPINSYEYSLFGETAFVLATAATPDIVFLSYYYADVNKEYLEMQRQYIRFRFGCDEIFFHASNTVFINNHIHKKIDYMTLKFQRVIEKLYQLMDSLPEHLFNVFDSNLCDIVYKKVINELEENIDVI